MQQIYDKIQNKIKSTGVPVSEMSYWTQYYDLMMSLDTKFKPDTKDTFTYCGKKYPYLSGKTFTGSDLNYIGVGEGFSARGVSTFMMDTEIDIRLHLVYNGISPSDNTYAPAYEGYLFYMFNAAIKDWDANAKEVQH
jgi:hypothetical protein